MKICSKCHIEKDESEFRPYQYYCRLCKNEIDLYWRKSNKDKVRDINKRYRKRNGLTASTSNKIWKSLNKQHYLNYQIKWVGAQRSLLGDIYVKKILKKKGIQPIPELIELERSILKIKREIWKR